jgi:SAM-dependent methyltransferase
VTGKTSEMSVANADATRKIEYLNAPAEVRMADHWFEIASIEHFWIRRRFQVLQRLAGSWISNVEEMAEIGCGNGLLQRQIEDAYGREVTGFDLNEYALKQNVSRKSRVCCYDIFRRDAALHERYEVIFLFDVLEHIPEEDAFLQAVRFHLKPGGKLVVNVPAGQWAFSMYDTAAGHVRRYSLESLRESLRRNGLESSQATYWGLPLVPTLLLRKFWLKGMSEESSVIKTGFDPGSAIMNGVLGVLAQCEVIPQRILGTSLLMIAEARGPVE